MGGGTAQEVHNYSRRGLASDLYAIRMAAYTARSRAERYGRTRYSCKTCDKT